MNLIIPPRPIAHTDFHAALTTPVEFNGQLGESRAPFDNNYVVLGTWTKQIIDCEERVWFDQPRVAAFRSEVSALYGRSLPAETEIQIWQLIHYDTMIEIQESVADELGLEFEIELSPAAEEEFDQFLDEFYGEDIDENKEPKSP
jgi:hypothetical protein